MIKLYAIGLGICLSACHPTYDYLNYSPEDLNSDAAKRGLEHFHSVTTTDLAFSNKLRPLTIPTLLDMQLPVWPNDPGRTIGESRHPNGRTALNCGICHSGAVGGTFVGGLPNKHYNPAAVSKIGAIVSRLVPFIKDKTTKSTAEYGRQVLSKLSNNNDHTIGTNIGTWVVYSTMAHLVPGSDSMDEWDQKRSGAFKKMLDIVGGPLALQHPRPWWLARYNGRHFWFGYTPVELEHSAADLAMALSSPNYGNNEAYTWDDRIKISKDQQTYMHEIKSPEWPLPVNSKAVSAGKKIYDNNCAACHGDLKSTTGDYKYEYTRPTKPSTEVFAAVKTDREYWDLHVRLGYIVTQNLHTNSEFIKSGGVVNAPQPGDVPYMEAPPLVGVWASAPYLHNGSVPTLEDMLTRDVDRPKIWRLDEDPKAYDLKKVGALYTEVESDLDDPYIYDTVNRDPRNGMSNRGHNFGTGLSYREKRELIEFLVTLSTENVRPTYEVTDGSSD